MQMDFLIIEHETEEEFKEIAQELFNNYAIQNHDSTFRIIEIEFYWNSLSHKDESTYLRKYVDPKQGEWFFHYSGVDIALKNELNGGYGGILIRGIYDIKEHRLYKGPMVSAMKLFSCTNAFSESIKTRIIKHEFRSTKVLNDIRIGLGNNAKQSGTAKLNYRYYIDPNDIR